MSAAYTLEINSVERELRTGTLNFQAVINGRDVLSCSVLSEGGAYRPTLGQTLKLKEDSTYIFGGLIDHIEETGADGLPIDHIENRVTAVAFNVYFERRYITETFTAGMTIEDVATVLVNSYLSDYGVTLDPAQDTGDTLTADLVVDGELLSSFLERFTTATGYFAKIDPAKQFRMFTAGDVAAPINVVDGDAHHVGDIRVTRIREKQRPNTIIIKYGPNGNLDITDTFTGDGSTDTFDLSGPIVGPLITTTDGAVGRGYVDHLGTESLGGLVSGQTWLYDPSADPPTIQRSLGAPANGTVFSVTYTAQFPQTVTVTDAADIVTNGPIEAVYLYDTVTSKAEAQVLGAALLAKGQADKTEVTYDTYEIGIEPGQTQTITAADRNVNGSFLITEVNATNDVGTQDVRRTVRAVLGTTFTGSFRDVYNDWLNIGSGGPSSTSTAGPQLSTSFGGTALRVAILRLTNNQILSVADVPQLVVPAPGGGPTSPAVSYRIKVIAASLRLMTIDGAYTNISPNAAFHLICGGKRMSTGWYNNPAVPTEAFTNLFGNVHDVVADVPVPAMDAIEGGISSPVSPPDVQQYVMGEDAASLPDAVDVENVGVYLLLDNDGDGDFTGGGATNGLKLTVYYVGEDITPDWTDPLIQAGSLVFSTGGAFEFVSPSGNVYAAPPSAPDPGSSNVSGMVGLVPSGRTVSSGSSGGAGNPGHAHVIWDYDFTVHVVGRALAQLIGRDTSNHSYVVNSNTLYKVDSAGVTQDSWTLDQHGGGGPYSIAISPDGSVAYYAADSAATVIYAWDLVGDTDLGTFITAPAGFQMTSGGGIVYHNRLITLSNGNLLVAWDHASLDGKVEEYDDGGNFVDTYALEGGADPWILTEGFDDTSFWVSYDASAVGGGNVRVREIEVGTGTVLNSFIHRSETAFCVLRKTVG